MKIEKMSDNQIRCTLDAEDLELRRLDLSSLTYGSLQAQNLLKEVMETAAKEVGFTANDQPLVVEAVPISNNELEVVITRVEYPEELDTRFSRFTPANPEDMADEYDEIVESTPEQTKPDLMARLADAVNEAKKEQNGEEESTTVETTDSGRDKIRIYAFQNMEKVIALSKVIRADFQGASELYKNVKTGEYVMLFAGGVHTASEFKAICETVSEYGSKYKRGNDADRYIREHYTPVIKEFAVEHLAMI